MEDGIRLAEILADGTSKALGMNPDVYYMRVKIQGEQTPALSEPVTDVAPTVAPPVSAPAPAPQERPTITADDAVASGQMVTVEGMRGKLTRDPETNELILQSGGQEYIVPQDSEIRPSSSKKAAARAAAALERQRAMQPAEDADVDSVDEADADLLVDQPLPQDVVEGIQNPVLANVHFAVERLANLKPGGKAHKAAIAELNDSDLDAAERMTINLIDRIESLGAENETDITAPLYETWELIQAAINARSEAGLRTKPQAEDGQASTRRPLERQAEVAPPVAESKPTPTEAPQSEQPSTDATQAEQPTPEAQESQPSSEESDLGAGAATAEESVIESPIAPAAVPSPTPEAQESTEPEAAPEAQPEPVERSETQDALQDQQDQDQAPQVTEQPAPDAQAEGAGTLNPPSQAEVLKEVAEMTDDERVAYVKKRVQEMQDSDPNIGREWKSNRGTKTIKRLKNSGGILDLTQPTYEVELSNGALFNHRSSDIEETIREDEYRTTPEYAKETQERERQRAIAA